MMVNISYLEVPLNKDWNKMQKLKDAMYLTAQPLYKTKQIKWTDLHKIVKSDYRQYSPFVYQDGTKKSENWNNDKQNILVLDIDDGLSINEARLTFKEYKYFICTTKSHQVEKKGIKCDRFRIFLASNNIPRGDDYFDLCRELEKKYPFIDKQVNTKTGSFLGFSKCEYWYNDGVMFDCSELIDIAKRKKELEVAYSSNNTPKKYNAEISTELPLEQIKSRLNREIVADIVQSKGFDVDRNFKFKYRTDERTPSASIRHDGLIKDFGSDLSTDAIGFIQEVDKVDFKTAVNYVANFVGVA